MAKIVIGVPIPKDYSIDTRTAWYIFSESAPNVMFAYASSRDAGVGRSTIVHGALKDHDVTHVYFMDYDVVPPKGTLQKLLNYKLPIVAGIYRMNTNDISWSFKTNDRWQSVEEPLGDEIKKVKCVGGSTLLVEREVLEKLPEPCFKIEYRKIDSMGRCYDEGEDEYFSRIAQEAGYDLIVDPTIKCKHYNYGEI